MNRPGVASGLRCIVAQRGMLHSLVLRDLESRYRGTLLGFSWAVLYPLLMLSIYAFVFGGVFGARWQGQGRMADFVVMLYCGLIVHGLFSDTVTRSPSAVLATPSYVKKVVFPLELLPLAHLGAAAFNAIVSLALLFGYLLIDRHTLPLTVVLVPLVLLPLVLLTSGCAWVLAGLGVFFRDLGQLITVVASVMLFLSPIFYPIQSMPPTVQALAYLNPLAYPIEALRQVAVQGTLPNWGHLAAYTLVGALVFAAGLWIFQRVRPAFADVV